MWTDKLIHTIPIVTYDTNLSSGDYFTVQSIPDSRFNFHLAILEVGLIYFFVVDLVKNGIGFMLSKYLLWSLNLLKLLHKSSNRMNTIDMLNQPSKLHSGVNVLLVPPVCIHLDPLSTIYLAQSIHDMFGRVPLLQMTMLCTRLC